MSIPIRIYDRYTESGYLSLNKKKQVLIRIWRKENTCALLVGLQIGAATMEKRMEVPKKLKIGQPYDPGIQLLGVYLKKSKTLI